MLPAPIWPLAEHAAFGQNWFDASIGSGVLFCIRTSCRGPSIFSSLLPQFHRLVGSYQRCKGGFFCYLPFPTRRSVVNPSSKVFHVEMQRGLVSFVQSAPIPV